MTIGEELEFEAKIGHRPSQAELREERIRRSKEIKAYINHHGYTDVNPFEVIRVVSPICVEARQMNTIQTKHPKDFHKGGFVGHFADNREGQEYDYFQAPDNPIIRVRWSKAKNQWQSSCGRHVMSDKPFKFYDYNF